MTEKTDHTGHGHCRHTETDNGHSDADNGHTETDNRDTCGRTALRRGLLQGLHCRKQDNDRHLQPEEQYG